MGKMQRDKGKRWEREVAARFREVLPKQAAAIHRGWQARAGADAPDVDVPGWWPECKVGKEPPVMPALRQAIEASAGTGRVPVAVVKQDRHDPVVCLLLDDFMDLVAKVNW